MKDDNRAKAEAGGMPDFHWINQLPDAAVRPFRVQMLLWREMVSAMADMAEIRAECLRKLACVNSPMDAAAIQNEYMHKLMQSAENEGNRIVVVLKGAFRSGRDKG